MVKIPNLGDLAGKADVAGMLNKVKSIINNATAGSPSEQLAEANEETLRAKLVEIEDVMKQTKEVQNQQAGLISSLENKLNELAAIVVAIKAPAKPVVTPANSESTTANTESK